MMVRNPFFLLPAKHEKSHEKKFSCDFVDFVGKEKYHFPLLNRSINNKGSTVNDSSVNGEAS